MKRLIVTKKTAGQQILEHDALRLDIEDDVIEYRKAMEPAIIKRLYSTAHEAKNKPQYIGRDFYIVMITTNDRALRSPKIIILARKSCPTPVYKQSVWKYNTFSDNLEFLWTIPDEILYWYIWNNRHKVASDSECADIAKFVILMETGELLDWIKKENGEKIDAVIHINEENSQWQMN